MKVSLPDRSMPDDPVPGAVEVDEDRGLAGAGGLAHAHLDDEAVGDELGDEVGDRDAGEPGLAGEVGPAHRPLVEQRLQHERAVVTAGVLGEYFGPLAQRASGGEGAGLRGRVRRVDEGRAALRFRAVTCLLVNLTNYAFRKSVGVI